MYPNSIRSMLLLGAALTAIFPTTVTAQDAVSDDDATTAAAAELKVYEMIVTARRRSERAQDIPIAVSVLDSKQLDETGAFNVNRLQQLAPTLQFYSSNPRNTAVNIRGLGVPFGLTSDGFEQGVGIYVDDVYYSRVASATFDFLDVAQIEVLRGPQGTLYGKNTTAGAINITTNQPSFDFEGRAEISLGNLEFRQAGGDQPRQSRVPAGAPRGVGSVIGERRRPHCLFRHIAARYDPQCHDRTGYPEPR
ncbi:outer membrane receptor protein involved in Fe transport [Porphyrobacter sp. MBR-155]|jgi:iron complex outermembrane receptor protein